MHLNFESLKPLYLNIIGHTTAVFYDGMQAAVISHFCFSTHARAKPGILQALKYFLQRRLTKCPMTFSLGWTYV